MRIHFERSGGITGMLVSTTIDTDALPAEEARSLREMLTTADFFQISSEVKGLEPVPDQFLYKLTVEDEDQRHTVETTDSAAPEALRPVLRRLTVLARRSASN